MKREFLQLAHLYDVRKHNLGGMWASEKLDGMRCYWDGGITRGLPKASVPWANNAKDERYVNAPYATGLWSRYGNVIHAPDWWLDALPLLPLDGELWIRRGEGGRQQLMATIKDLIPSDAGWASVRYCVFDIPSYEVVFADGQIDNVNYKKKFSGILPWLQSQARYSGLAYKPPFASCLFTQYDVLGQMLESSSVARRHPQTRLPHNKAEAAATVDAMLKEVVDLGGEGLVVRDPHMWYACQRSKHVLKIKPLEDAEGIVTGYISGRETDKGSKLLGMMGALILRLDNGQRLELSGFTNLERQLQGQEAVDWATANPGEELPPQYQCKAYPRGLRVTFQYRGLSSDGVPQEARYMRVRTDE